MPGLRKNNHRLDIGTKNKFAWERPVEIKNEFVLRMLPGNPLQGFKGKTGNPVNTAFDQ
jgi:hypothetical protein